MSRPAHKVEIKPVAIDTSMANLKVGNELDVFNREFTLISCEGTEITIPVYDLMAWSIFFRNLLQTGCGEMRVEVQERAETIGQFKQLIETREVEWPELSVPLFTQVFDLAFFLDKYDCPRALDLLFDVLKQGVHGETKGAPAPLPPLLLFAVGARLGRSEICASALDAPRRPWGCFSVWTFPTGIGARDADLNTLHPRGIPYQLLTEMPFNYVVALSLMGVEQYFSSGMRDEVPKGAKFTIYLEDLTRRS